MSEGKVISFRLDKEFYTSLADKASDGGQSVSECARELLLSALKRADFVHPPAPGNGDVVSEIHSLRSELSVLIEAILIATKALTPNEAHEIVKGHIQ